MGRRGILRAPSSEPSGHRVKFRVSHDGRKRISYEAPPSGFSDAGSHNPEIEEITPRERLSFLTHEVTLSNVRRRISRMTGIQADSLRGVCVHGQLRMYRACGYDERLVEAPAVREEEEARMLRKALKVRERGRFKANLAGVIAGALHMRYSTVMKAGACEFQDLAVRAVSIKARCRRGNEGMSGQGSCLWSK